MSHFRGNVQEIARELDVRADLNYLWQKEIKLNPKLAFGYNGKKQLTAILCKNLSKHYIIRNVYGLHEYTVYTHKNMI